MPELPPRENADPPDPDQKLSRRQFARNAALAASTVVIAPATLLLPEAAAQSAAPAIPQAVNGLSAELQAEGELKYRWVIERYGSRLSEAEKKDVHRLIMEGQKPLAAFRAFSLDNSDQPALVLKFTDAEMSIVPGRAALAHEAGEGSGK